MLCSREANEGPLLEIIRITCILLAQLGHAHAAGTLPKLHLLQTHAGHCALRQRLWFPPHPHHDDDNDDDDDDNDDDDDDDNDDDENDDDDDDDDDEA